MNRDDLRATLESYDARDSGEAASLALIRRFLDSPADPFARDNPEGHITGSAIVARPDGAAFLLIHHRKLGRWLQPGGHTEESDGSVFDTALREAREETGIARFEAPLERAIFDVDVHPIPARPREPAHFHFDVRFLLTSLETLHAAAAEDPSRPMRWMTCEETRSRGFDASLIRALEKAGAALANSPSGRFT